MVGGNVYAVSLTLATRRNPMLTSHRRIQNNVKFKRFIDSVGGRYIRHFQLDSQVGKEGA